MEELVETKESLKYKQLRLLNVERSLETAHEHLDKYKDIINFIADHDPLPGVQRLIKTSRNNRDGPGGLYARLESAANGAYRARNYTDDDFDLSALLYILGGSGAVHATHHSHVALPALKTTRKLRQETALKVSTGHDVTRDAVANIRTVFCPRESPARPPRRIGVSLATDEVFGDGRVAYLPKTDELAGFCHEHVRRLLSVKVGDDLTTTSAAVQAVSNDEVHIGKEFSVVAIAPHAPSRYDALPIVLSPTCKRGDVADSYRFLVSCVRAWKESEWGERWTGPLWAIASDGDATRRAAMFALCMKHDLDPNSSLYQRLHNCAGLNLRVGDDNLVMDFDYKHIIKRICTVLCSRRGMVANDISVNKALLSIWLQKLTTHDWSEMSIHALLNPKDPQDVPRAIMLLLRITDLRYLDSSDFNASEKRIHQALCVIGDMLEALLEPFLNVRLALPGQFRRLVKSAHMFFTLFRLNSTSFISGQLLFDIQSMVKHATFHIGQSQEFDEGLEVCFNIFGTDVVEALFGRVRMSGGHSANMNIADLAHRSSMALQMAEIFSRHREWERKPERLKFSRSRDYDHVTPYSWKGDIVAKSCNIAESWKAGAADAAASLRAHGIIIDFDALFTSSDVDLMRPKGGRVYPGVAKAADRSMAEETPSEPIETGPDTPPNPPEVEAADPSELDENSLNELTARLSAHDAAVSRSPVSQEDDRPRSHSEWLEFGNRLQHKSTIARVAFGSTGDPNIIQDRLLRVRHHNTTDSWNQKLRMTSVEALPRRELFQLGDLFATLVRVQGKEVALAIALCVAIKPNSGSASVDVVPRAELLVPGAKYQLDGHILSMEPTSVSRWHWTSSFVALEAQRTRQAHSARPASNPITRGELVFSVPIQLAFLLAEEASNVPVFDLPLEQRARLRADFQSTWVFEEATMRSLGRSLWDRLKEPANGLMSAIPTFGKVISGAFPYNDRSSPSASHIVASAAPLPPKAKEKLSCRICGEKLVAKECQNHIGRHILRAMHNKSPEAQQAQVALPYACGFCGGPSSPSGEEGTCSVTIDKGQLAQSSCAYTYSFRISSAAQFKEEKPSSTNVPIRCVLCNQAHWKYNMVQHLNDQHPTWNARIPKTSPFRATITISDAEQHALVAADKVPVQPALKRAAQSPPTTPNRRHRDKRKQEDSSALPVGILSAQPSSAMASTSAPLTRRTRQ
ncbi:hypothetical protein EV122DRAFT_278718 [Schizophyllum commune]